MRDCRVSVVSRTTLNAEKKDNQRRLYYSASYEQHKTQVTQRRTTDAYHHMDITCMLRK
jgi:hypothetical protein